MVETINVTPVEHPEGKLSFEEFLCRYEGRHAEWIDGEVYLYMPPSIRHQLLLGYLYILLSTFLEQRPLGTLLFAPVAMRIQVGESQRAREPDLLFLSTEHIGRLMAGYIDGPVDLAVEIVSPESNDRDRGTKFAEYEAAGVPEYWLIDPLRSEASFYYRGQDGRYHRLEPQPDGSLRSLVIPGFRLDVPALWSDPLPTVSQIAETVRRMLWPSPPGPSPRPGRGAGG